MKIQNGPKKCVQLFILTYLKFHFRFYFINFAPLYFWQLLCLIDMLMQYAAIFRLIYLKKCFVIRRKVQGLWLFIHLTYVSFFKKLFDQNYFLGFQKFTLGSNFSVFLESEKQEISDNCLSYSNIVYPCKQYLRNN